MISYVFMNKNIPINMGPILNGHGVICVCCFYSRKRIPVNRLSLFMHSVVGYVTLNKQFYSHEKAGNGNVSTCQTFSNIRKWAIRNRPERCVAAEGAIFENLL